METGEAESQACLHNWRSFPHCSTCMPVPSDYFGQMSRGSLSGLPLFCCRWLGNSISSIPVELGEMLGLLTMCVPTVHSLSGRRREARSLTTVSVLLCRSGLSDNVITTIPAELGNLLNLTGLFVPLPCGCPCLSMRLLVSAHCMLCGRYISGNAIASVPRELGNLQNLESL